MQICLEIGAAASNAPCSRTTGSTGCVEGHVCVDDPDPVCRPSCETALDTESCEPGALCGLDGICRLHQSADPAAPDEPCALDSVAGTPCAEELGRARGACLPPIFFEAPSEVALQCVALCGSTLACPEGGRCATDMWAPGVGLCWPGS